jgi:hypothetical protein
VRWRVSGQNNRYNTDKTTNTRLCVPWKRSSSAEDIPVLSVARPCGAGVTSMVSFGFVLSRLVFF